MGSNLPASQMTATVVKIDDPGWGRWKAWQEHCIAVGTRYELREFEGQTYRVLVPLVPYTEKQR